LKQWFGQEQDYHGWTPVSLLVAVGTSNLTTAQVVELLCAAAKSTSASRYLCRLPQAKHLTAEQVVEVAAAALQRWNSELLQLLCGTAAAVQQLCTAQVAGLLETAVTTGNDRCLSVLAGTYCAAALPNDTVMRWLKTAMRRNTPATVAALCRLHAARQVSPEQVADMLAAAMKRKHADLVAMLAGKYKRAAVAPDALLCLLQSAVQQNSTMLISILCGMDAALQLTVARMAGLFKGAVQQQQCDAAAHLLCWFEEWLRQLEEEQQMEAQQQSATGTQARQQLQQHGGDRTQQQQQRYQQQLRKAAVSSQVMVLLRTAVQQRCSRALSYMCKLSLVQQAVNTPVAVGLLQLAVKLGSSSMEAEDLQACKALCSLPALKQLQPQQVVDLLLHALRCKNTDAVWAISKLPAVYNLAAAENAEQLLQLAAAEGLMGPAGKKCKWFASVAAQLRRLPAAAAAGRTS
jgi:hypothetical protein